MTRWKPIRVYLAVLGCTLALGGSDRGKQARARAAKAKAELKEVKAALKEIKDQRDALTTNETYELPASAPAGFRSRSLSSLRMHSIMARPVW